jgi:hypothetical protein
VPISTLPAWSASIPLAISSSLRAAVSGSLVRFDEFHGLGRQSGGMRSPRSNLRYFSAVHAS